MKAGSVARVSSAAPDWPSPAARNSSHDSSPSRGGLAVSVRRTTIRCSTSFGRGVERLVDEREEVDVLALAVGDVAREQEARAAGPDPFAERAGPEAREHDAVHRPDPRGREHRDDRLGGGRDVDREAVALADAEAAQAGGDPLDLGEELGVGQGAAAAPLVEGDEGDLIAASGGDVPIQRVDGHVGPPAGKPAE